MINSIKPVLVEDKRNQSKDYEHLDEGRRRMQKKKKGGRRKGDASRGKEGKDQKMKSSKSPATLVSLGSV